MNQPGRRPTTADVAVVGTGIIGAAIGHHLTVGGAGVTFVDQAAGIATGATHASGGMVRAYDPDPAVGELASAGLRAYADPVLRPTGRSPLTTVGALTITPPESAPDVRNTVRRIGGTSDLPVHILEDGAESMGVRLAGGVAVVEPEAGYVRPPRVAEECILYACRSTASLRLGTRALGVGRLRRGITLRTSAGTITAGAVVVATGGWTPEWAGDHPPLRTRSIQVAAVRRPEGVGPHATFVDLRTGVYAKPLDGGLSLLGMPHLVWDVPPSPVSAPDTGHTRNTLQALTPHLPWPAEAEVIDEIRSFDGYGAGDELVRGSPDGRLWAVRAWNGTGVKVAPEVGRIVSESVLAHL